MIYYSINLNILECKFCCKLLWCSRETSINLNILECKSGALIVIERDIRMY